MWISETELVLVTIPIVPKKITIGLSASITFKIIN